MRVATGMQQHLESAERTTIQGPERLGVALAEELGWGGVAVAQHDSAPRSSDAHSL